MYAYHPQHTAPPHTMSSTANQQWHDPASHGSQPATAIPPNMTRGARSGPPVSPLDVLVRQGQASASDPSPPPSHRQQQQHGSRSQVYERAFALSRATSIRRGAADDDTTGDGDKGKRSAAPADRSSRDLLSRNVFRGSMASDASFNTITGQTERGSILYGSTDEELAASRRPGLDRRDSVDTVRTAEFDADGRWGRAWANKAEDEESLYGGSEWGSVRGGNGDGDEDDDDEEDEDEDDLGGHGLAGQGLDALRQLAGAQTWQGLTLSDVAQGTPRADQGPRSQAAAVPSTSAVHLQPHDNAASSTSNSRERIVSLTPSLHGMFNDSERGRAGMPLPSGGAQSHNRTWSHHSNDSVSTLGPEGAHVYVWPPTPEGSEISHEPFRHSAVGASSSAPMAADAASVHEWEAVSDDEDEDEDGDGDGDRSRRADRRHTLQQDAQQRQSLAMAPPRPRRQASADSAAPGGPVTVSEALAARTQPASGSPRLTSVDGRKGGHPTGRLPPPLPPSAGRYEDPNAALSSGSGLGRARAAAIAAAGGRDSIVSDLDVETLRLDGSSRRDSTSTIGSTATSRMSVGTVHYEDGVVRPRHPSWRPKDPEASSRSPSLMATPLARPQPQPMARSATAPSPARSNSGPVLGSHPPPIGNHAAQAGRPPLRQTATSRPNTSTASPATMTPRSVTGQDTKTGPSAAESFLTQGIAYHEQGDMSRSAYYFERSAKVDGGCVVGMCMWGMTLREGWGARKDPRKGFEWIQRAAARAGELMQAANNTSAAGGHRSTEAEMKAIRSELKLSVYELGKCFCHGWGIKMDKHMALEYFELAAKLGDADAQAEAGALYAAGKGCKKDLKKAAKYYRMAAAQGYDLIGLSWVWKPKFDEQ